MDNLDDASEARKNFVRLAEARTQKAIDAIHLIGNLSNPTNYSYREQDVEQIFRALDAALKTSRSRFRATKRGKKSVGFRLKNL